jgi:putative endonuclease
MFYVYIIQSVFRQKLYIGQTQDIDSRLLFHNSGRAKYTKPYMPWKLIAHKSFGSRSEAILMERKLKNLKSKEAIFEFTVKNEFITVDPDE